MAGFEPAFIDSKSMGCNQALVHSVIISLALLMGSSAESDLTVRAETVPIGGMVFVLPEYHPKL